MELVDDTTKKTVLDVSERRVDPDITLETDWNPIYGACAKEMGATNSVTLSSDEPAHEVFKWVDTLISNCKKFIDGTYHGEQRTQTALSGRIRLSVQSSRYRIQLG